jgi:uncharacterized protein YgiB involved in biofilm formation
MAVRDTCGDMITRARMKTDLFRWAVGASIALTVLVIAGVLLFRKEEDFARVMATPQDCLRAFDDAACRKLMKQALDIHYRRAPQYRELQTCEMMLGAGACTLARIPGRPDAYVPALVAILVSREGLDDASSLLPLHEGKKSRSNPDGPRMVYFAGTPVGQLTTQRFGGAAITQVRDRAGAPITVERLQQLRRLAR